MVWGRNCIIKQRGCICTLQLSGKWKGWAILYDEVYGEGGQSKKVSQIS